MIAQRSLKDCSMIAKRSLNDRSKIDLLTLIFLWCYLLSTTCLQCNFLLCLYTLDRFENRLPQSFQVSFRSSCWDLICVSQYPLCGVKYSQCVHWYRLGVPCLILAWLVRHILILYVLGHFPHLNSMMVPGSVG